jgi:hypothetical protein
MDTLQSVWGLAMRVLWKGQLGVGKPTAGWPCIGFLCAGLLAGMLPAAAAGSDRQPAPWVKLSLEKLGFPGVSNTFLEAGASLLTVNFLDDGHLLVTFGLRKLVPRLPGDASTDDDRLVAAEVVELPSGKVLAKTEWHMHDHGRYLWPLGQGRFLVRIGDRLSTMTPLVNLKTDPFARTLFPGRGGRPTVVYPSQDGRLLTVEIQVRLPGQEKTSLVGDMDTAARPQTETVIDFYRLSAAAPGSDSGMEVASAGAVLSQQPIYIPVDGDGYLWAQPNDRNRWSVTFDTFAGKTLSLGQIDSTCDPRLQMVSPSEFLAFTCRGGDDHVKMAAYGLDGQETWEEPMGALAGPVFAYAPAAGRFAISHTSDATPAMNSGNANLNQGSPTRQEVRVYQIASGDLLLKVDCGPVFKTAENFDLSSDGMLAAVVREGAVAIYRLPELGKRDREDIAAVAKFAPPAGNGPVVLGRLTGPRQTPEQTQSATVAPATPATPAPPAPTPSDTPRETAGADPSADPTPRTPPTLLKPGEKAEFPANGRPQ